MKPTAKVGRKKEGSHSKRRRQHAASSSRGLWDVPSPRFAKAVAARMQDADAYFLKLREPMAKALGGDRAAASSRLAAVRSEVAVQLNMADDHLIRRIHRRTVERTPETAAASRTAAALRRLRKRHERNLSEEFLGALDAEVEALEAEVNAHETERKEVLRQGRARARRNEPYYIALCLAMKAMREVGLTYPGAEAARFVWHCGAHALEDVDAINPFQPRSSAGMEADYALDKDVRKVVGVFRKRLQKTVG